MSTDQKQDLEVQLTIKDRLNFPYLLANQIMTFQKALLALEYSEREIRETIEGLEHMIPQNWKDKKFKRDVRKARIKRLVDVRPWVVAGVRMSEAACVDVGIPAFVEKKAVDYYRVFQAIIDLLERRGLMSRRSFTEKMTGKPFVEGMEEFEGVFEE